MSNPDTVNTETGPTNAELEFEKLRHPQYDFNNKVITRNCKHLQNKQQQQKQQQHQHNLTTSRRNEFQYNDDNENEEPDNADSNLSNTTRGLSLEGDETLYDQNLQIWTRQQIKFNSTNNIQDYGSSGGSRSGSGSGHGNSTDSGSFSINGGKMTAQEILDIGDNRATTKSFQHIIYNNEAYESHLTINDNNTGSNAVIATAAAIAAAAVQEETENIEKSVLTSNKTYKKFLLPIDIPTPPLPYSFNITKRLLSSQAQCQCENHINFAQFNGSGNSITKSNSNSNCNSNSNNDQVNHQHHISFIQQKINENEASAMGFNKNFNGSSVGIGNGHNYKVHNQQQQQQQHHHLCQQKNLKLQNFSNHHQQQQNYPTHPHQQHIRQQHLQQTHHHHYYQQHELESKHNEQYSPQQQQQHHHYLPQLPQLLYQQHNSLSTQNMAPTTFNRIADKNYMKNLVYSPQKRRLRIILYIVGGIVLLALLGTALYFIISGSSDSSNNDDVQPSEGIHLDDVLQGKLIARHFNGSWSTGNNVLYKEDNAIMEYNVVTKQKTRLMLDELQQYILYEKSADGSLLLLAKNYKKNFRHSYEAEYDIYNLSTGQIQPLLIQRLAQPLIMVQWAPVGNALIINFQRNLYYKPTALADEVALTFDTNAAILNGIPDWVYEEEIFSSNSASWFSPDGNSLAFIQFDDSPTNVINFPVYGEAGDLRFQYPFNRLVAYPKAGSPNPRVKLFTSDLVRAAAGNTDHLTEIPVPSALNTEGDYIITVVDWLNNTNVLSVWMNRIQNSAHMQIFNGVRRQEIYSLESKSGWVDFFSAPFKNRDGSRIALILPQAQDADGDYRHICLLSTTTTTSQPEAITRGKYVVTSILHWDSSNDIIFYTANTEANPELLHVYSIKAATGQTAKCLTCKLHTSNGVEQTYYSADFNTANQVIITSLGPSIPQTSIYEWSVASNQVSLNRLVLWEDNESLITKLKGFGMPTYEILNIPISNGFQAKVLLQLPPNMDRSGKTKYPLLVDVYGGPDSYSVVNKWIVDWGTYLTSNQSVIYAKIDGRGSGLRGEKLLHSVYLKLGTVEVQDQIDVTRQLQEKYNFIDANHTGIWGWSYGGYAAAMALANDETSVFRCAASIAPVTDWTYYDSIYTERYMGLPSVNEEGYANSRLSTRATKLKGKKFLLVHGTLDDNVHYQQAMILAKNLERHDILFKQISYPDEDHALAGVRPHLYHSLDRFFGDCFAQPRMALSK